jgi:signal peptidase I
VISKTIKDNYVQAFKISSGGMEPTLLIGDQILVNQFQYKSEEPKRGDIVIFKNYPKDPSRNFIQRIIGVGGDIIEIKDRQLYINSNKVEEHFIQHLGPAKDQAEMLDRLIDFGPVTVPQDSFFTMGDNRDRSYDSRFWGFVKRSEIKGKTSLIYWSWDKNKGKVRWERIGKIIN